MSLKYGCTCKSRQELEDKLLDKVLKVLYFYVDQNPDNCILALSTEILNVFALSASTGAPGT